MKKFRVYANGFNMGIFEAEDESAALEAYAQDAGYQSLADMNAQLESEAEYEVVEEENEMKSYKIYANGFDMGIFAGADERAALEAYAQDAGYESMDDMNERLESDPAADKYEVVEVE